MISEKRFNRMCTVAFLVLATISAIIELATYLLKD